ncbi:PQQ-binding-like beta-propeller repeat protein [Flagellimonas sp.]|uniref:outer membrane protein assembly factor BamB family protein n=1 Tax=Flagellimonas sp. TaxID=2058762 RepID=UPI003B507743
MRTTFKSLSFHLLILVTTVFLFQSCKEQQSTPQDWPQFKKDNYRSGNSEVQLDVSTLGQDWTYQASQQPVPAWYGPAKEDTYAKSGPLPSMRDYDLAYYPIIVGDRLYYGSSADNAIHCLDANTGEELWTYITGGPVRVAPTFYSGKLYFGSDDGYAYCIKASNGKLVWKFSPTEKVHEKVMNNNSLISFWPVRTGVLIEDDVAYFGASLLPWKESFFCAVDIRTGKVGKKGTYIQKFEQLTLEGSMASTGTKIVQPQGRISPVFFNKMTGENNGQLAGTGGCFVLITPEKNIVHPQTSREKSITESFGEAVAPIADGDKKQADFMSFKGGKEMVVKNGISYILTDNSISAYDRVSKKVIWAKRNYLAHRLIISGDMLYLGGTDAVYAVSTKNGNALWQANVQGTVYAMAVANDGLFVSTGEGRIYKFAANKKENPIYAINKDKPAEIDNEIVDPWTLEDGNLELTVGPFVNILGPNKVEVHFITEKPVSSTLTWGNAYGQQTIVESGASTEHRIIVEDVRKDFTYQYQISIGGEKTKSFEFDNFFNFTSSRNETDPAPDSSGDLLKEIKKLNKDQKGLAVVFDADNQDLALEIAQYTPLKVLFFETSKSKVEDLREEWQPTGFYGGKIEAHYVKDYGRLPITGDAANIVMVNDADIGSADEVIRLVKPDGYAVLNKENVDFKDWIDQSERKWQVDEIEKEELILLKKAPYENVGQWTHQYGRPNNSAFGGESLWGSTTTDDFEIQWMGRPGPRFQTDRNGRKPSPLAANGKMFVQGRERIIAVDAFNGNVFWSKEIPQLSRMNVIRDCSNWSADDDYVYLAHKNNLLKIDNADGSISRIIPVVKSTNEKENDWGYISLLNDKIIGSAVPKGGNYTNYYGGEGWYDAQSGPLAYKVVSHSLFAKQKRDDKDLWVYEREGAYIINPTITISDDQIVFVESRNPRFRLSEDLRAGPDVFKNMYLVALNSNTGEINWEQAIDTKPGLAAYFMAGSNGRIVIVSSYEGTYYIYNYDSTSGKPMWENQLPWPANHHGAHFSKPAIVDNRLIVKPGVFKLDTGELQKQEVPKAGHGCASYALTEQSAFYRGYSVTQFNFDTDKFTQWERLRPDCWLSTIPAHGMILSPEAGGGCSCGNWFETSMVFAPKSRAPITFIYEDNKFLDSLAVTIKTKGDKGIYYTLDGSEPTKTSKKYNGSVVLNKTCTLKAAVFIDKDGYETPFSRTREFTRIRPEPKIVETPQLIDGQWQFSLQREGNSGDIHYTVDNTRPTPESPKYTSPVVMEGNTLVRAKTFWKDGDAVLESEENSFEVKIPDLGESVSVTNAQPGILRSYFLPDGNSENYDLNVLKPKEEVVVQHIDAGPYEHDRKFGLRFKGYINIPVDGVYTFSGKTLLNISMFSLHGKLEIDNRGGNKEMSKVLALKKGLHPFTLDFLTGNGTGIYNLYVEGPKMKKTSIPAEMLFYTK